MPILKSLYHREKFGNHSINLGAACNVVEDFDCIQDDCHTMHCAMDGSVVPPVSCAFSKVPGFEHILAVADEDGSVRIVNTEKRGIDCYQEHWLAHSNAIFDIAWLDREPQILTASGDQTAVLWNIETVTKLATFKGHSCSLKAVSCIRDNKFIFATCARDGNIMIWDTRCNKRDGCYTPVDAIRSAHTNTAVSTPRQRKKSRLCYTKPASDSQQSVTAIVFQDEHSLLSAGAMDGAIKMWDLRKNYNRIKEPTPWHVIPYAGSSLRKRGFSSLVLDSTCSRVFASCTDSTIYQYDCTGTSTTPVALYTGHLHSTFYVKSSLSLDDNFLLSGSSDDDAYIWQVGKSEEPICKLKGHINEVTSVAWNHKDFSKIVTCSDDNTVKIWRLNRREKPLPANERSGWCEKYTTSDTVSATAVCGTDGSSDVAVTKTVVSTLKAPPEIQQLRTCPLSPLPATCAPASPVSNIPKLAATLPLSPSQFNATRKYVSPKLRDTSIKNWFAKKDSVKKSSPRKSPVKEKENVRGCGDDVAPRGVKRKIEDDERFSQESKVQICQETNFSAGDLQPLEQHFLMDADETVRRKAQKLQEVHSNVESNVDKTSSPRRDNFKCSTSTSEQQICGSPTVNLPNLVLDLPKRANAQKETNTCTESKKKINWLCQLAKQKQLPGKESSPGRERSSPKLLRMLKPSSKDISPSRSRSSSPKISQQLSPVSPKSPSIRHYFQPVPLVNGVKK